MNAHAPAAQQLTDAFLVFNDLSAQLEGAYRELEQRVAQLNEELAAARSERLRHLAERERLANRLEKLLEALPGGVVVLDGTGCVAECNPAALDLLGGPLLQQAWEAVCARAFAPRSDDTHHVSLHDGRQVTISRRPLDSEPGQILLLHDVTETRVLQEQVERQHRLTAMGEMTAGLAHQIRTPLSAALLYADHLGRPDLRAEERRRFCAKLTARLHYLERIVNDMLQFARGGGFGAERLSVDDLVSAFRAALEPQLHAAGGTCDVVGLAEDIKLFGNREALLGVLLNLATNALQATTGTPRLMLTLTTDGDGRLCMALSDNGPGIPDSVRARLFEPFFTTRPDGTGLGLAVVQAVVRAHRGHIDVQSSPGAGTTFTVSLPSADTQAALSSGGGRSAASARVQML
ncbi:MAG TPA: ATP-binding protein [Gammaproteobacteria bacterium]|nr:ATP-binding protein [Gammaproteobacteria bacterium]